MKAVQEKLCLAVAQLAVQDEGWKNVVRDLVPKFNGSTMACLLRILKLLPEECHSRRSTVSRERQTTMAADLDTAAGDILHLLTDCMRRSMSNIQLIKQVFGCLASWLRYSNIPVAMMAKSPMLAAPFDALVNKELFDAAIDVIFETLRMYHNPTRHMDVVKQIIPRVMALQPRYAEAVKAASQDDGEAEDVARGLIRVFVEMSEQYMELVLGPMDVNQAKVVEIVLHCSMHPSPELARITFFFWYKLAQGLHQMSNAELQRRRMGQIAPLFQQMVPVCLTLLTLPDDFSGASQADKDDALHYRGEVGEVLLDCCGILGGTRCAALLLQQLMQRCQQFSTFDLAGQTTRWHATEAALAAFVWISKELLRRDVPADALDSIVGGPGGSSSTGLLLMSLNLFGHIHKVAPNSPQLAKLQNTCLEVLGSFAPWVDRHPEHLRTLFQVSVTALGQKTTQVYAARVFFDVCDSCAGHLAHSKELLNAVLSVHQQAVAGSLPQNELLVITRGLSRLIRRLPTAEAARSGLQQLMKPCAAKLQAAAAATDTQNAPAIITVLETMTTIFSNIGRVKEEVLVMVAAEVKALWPALAHLAEKQSASPQFVEKVCRCYKHMIRCVGARHWQPFAEAFCKQMVLLFGRCHKSPLLYASGICVETMGKATDLTYASPGGQVFAQMLMQFAQIVLGHLGSPAALQDNPDIVEDFFDCATRFVTTCPALLLADPLHDGLSQIFRFAAWSLSVPHREANRSVLIFLEALLSLAVVNGQRSNAQHAAHAPALLKLLQVAGRDLVRHVVRGIAGGLPLDRVDDSDGSLTGVLYAIAALCPPNASRAVIGGELTDLSDQLAKNEDKQKFMATLFGTSGPLPLQGNKDAWYRAVLNFAKGCRRSQRQNNWSKPKA